MHRRGGKDVTVFNWAIFQLLCNPGWTAFHILPTYNQAKKVIWDSSTNDSQRILDYIPKELIESKNGQEMKIRLTNGSLYQLIGSDNIDSLVGTNPKIIIFSEYAIQSPAAWDYLRPILDVNKGYAIFISTPRGKNHFYDLLRMAKSNKDWYTEVLPITSTNVLSEADIDKIRAEGVSEELIQQEYYCSFNRGVEGSYYGKLIEKAYNENRICNVPYETRSPVHTAWDIGYGDSTSIVFWQEIGGEFRIIDFYENHGEGIAHYAKLLQNKPYVYGTHYMPHDAGSGSIQTGRTLQDVAYEIGLKTSILARESDIQIGIEAVRSLLNIAYIDKEKCAYLIKCLENYHKKYNDKTQAYSETPTHDWCSHACFIGKTIVKTDRGDIEIQNINIGDLVLTPFGYRKVLNIYKKNNDELLNIYVNDSYAFTCTKEHHIFTQKGLTYADSLRYNTLEKYTIFKSFIWKIFGFFYEDQSLKGFKKTILCQKMENPSCLTDFFIDGMDCISKEQSPVSIKPAPCIELFGFTIMEQLKRKWKFITKMVIQRIITYQIWNSCDLENTKVCMEGFQIHGLNQKNVSVNCANKMIKQSYGINPMKEKIGIDSMQEKVCQFYKGLNILKHVKYVLKNLKHMFYGKDSVVEDAKQNIVTYPMWIMKKGFAVYVSKVLKLINTLSKQHVVTNVEFKKCEIPEKVYDLTVEIDGCYYANGYLVSNSDSVRYMANARTQYGRGLGSLTPDKLRELKTQAGYGPKSQPKHLPNPMQSQFFR